MILQILAPGLLMGGGPTSPVVTSQTFTDEYQSSTELTGEATTGTMTGRARTQNITGKPGTE